MKKILLALTAVAAMTGSASAADLGARPYVKAPVAAPVKAGPASTSSAAAAAVCGPPTATSRAPVSPEPFGAFGPAGTAITRDQRLGGSGWFGTVGVGYDWQFSGRWVAGVFADGQFGDIRGSLSDPVFGN